MSVKEQVGNSLKWITLPTEYYDIEDGLQITKTQFKKHNYIKIKTNKHVNINKHTGTGTIKHTIECRKHPQQQLFTR